MIRALLYDGRSSGAKQALLSIAGMGTLALLAIRAGEAESSVPLSAVRIGERVGGTNRLLELPDGGSLEVQDNADFDAALETAHVRTREAPLRRLEGRWSYALTALLATAVGTLLFGRYGIPALAARAVRYIPESVDSYVGADSLRVLDRSVFQPSELSAERQAGLRRVFAEVAADAGGAGAHYRLELRGVFAHETGHLVNRHAMRMLVQGSASALLVAGVFGDVSGVSSLGATAPAVLVNSAYSRDLEREADAFAFRWMWRHGVQPARLGDLLERLAGEKGDETGGFLASHPDLRERVSALHSRRDDDAKP